MDWEDSSVNKYEHQNNKEEFIGKNFNSGCVQTDTLVCVHSRFQKLFSRSRAVGRF